MSDSISEQRVLVLDADFFALFNGRFCPDLDVDGVTAVDLEGRETAIRGAGMADHTELREQPVTLRTMNILLWM